MKYCPLASTVQVVRLNLPQLLKEMDAAQAGKAASPFSAEASNVLQGQPVHAVDFLRRSFQEGATSNAPSRYAGLPAVSTGHLHMQPAGSMPLPSYGGTWLIWDPNCCACRSIGPAYRAALHGFPLLTHLLAHSRGNVRLVFHLKAAAPPHRPGRRSRRCRPGAHAAEQR